MMAMSVEQIARSVDGTVVPPEHGEVPAGAVATTVVADSRQIAPGTVFVAIAGERVDGHDYVPGAGAKGAVAALVSRAVPGADVTQIVVGGEPPQQAVDGESVRARTAEYEIEHEPTVRALGRLARTNLELRRELPGAFSIIGITGSVGKTTTKDMLNALLEPEGPTVAPVGSFNNAIGLPLTALQVGSDTRFLIAEMGANHVGEIANLVSIAPPDVSVVLKVGVAHVGEFGSVERIAQAKSEIVQGLRPGGVVVLNAEDERVAAMSALAPGDVLWFEVGADKDSERTRAAGSTVWARDVATDELDRASFTLHTAQGQVPVSLGIPGAHNVANALAAAAVALYFEVPFAAIAQRLHALAHISPHRMALSHVDLPGASFTLIDDSYNANPDSVHAGLTGLMRWRGECENPYRIAVLGAMLELGEDEIDLHERVGRDAVQMGVDALVAVGSQSDEHFDSLASSLANGASALAAAPSERRSTPVVVKLVHSAQQADRVVARLAAAHPGTVVLLKGSHFSGLSALAEQWQPYGTPWERRGTATERV